MTQVSYLPNISGVKGSLSSLESRCRGWAMLFSKLKGKVCTAGDARGVKSPQRYLTCGRSSGWTSCVSAIASVRAIRRV